MPMAPPPDLDAMDLAAVARAVAERRLPPIADWNPAHCGDADMRIARDGQWFHAGAPIGREAMVRLFATLLRRESDGSYVLVTPVERLTIAVDDLPFVAVAMKSEGAGKDRRIAFRLNTGDPVAVDADHPLRFDADGPAVRVRDDLWARIGRSVYYELADIALAESPDAPGVWSAGQFFAMPA